MSTSASPAVAHSAGTLVWNTVRMSPEFHQPSNHTEASLLREAHRLEAAHALLIGRTTPSAALEMLKESGSGATCTASWPPHARPHRSASSRSFPVRKRLLEKPAKSGKQSSLTRRPGKLRETATSVCFDRKRGSGRSSILKPS